MIASLIRHLRAGRASFAARKLAIRACREATPSVKVTGATLQAVEAERFVFAVVLDPGYSFRGMPPHRIFAVSRGLETAHEIEGEEGERYRLRGIK